MDKKDTAIDALKDYWQAFENVERVADVPVVRCKDCKHKFMEDNVWACPFGLTGGPEFFCSYGMDGGQHD